MLLNFGNVPEFLILVHVKAKHPLKFEHHFINPIIYLSIKSLDTATEQYNFYFNSQF
jgi:hypothetical protein